MTEKTTEPDKKETPEVVPKKEKTISDYTKKDKKFFLIKVGEKASQEDPDQVTVNVNGDIIRLKRNAYVPVRHFHLEALKNAKKPVVSKEGMDSSRRREITGYAQRFPVERHAVLSGKEYIELKKIALKREITEKDVEGLLE